LAVQLQRVPPPAKALLGFIVWVATVGVLIILLGVASIGLAIFAMRRAKGEKHNPDSPSLGEARLFPERIGTEVAVTAQQLTNILAEYPPIRKGQYRKVACNDCGFIMPQNEASRVEEEKQVGRSISSRYSRFYYSQKTIFLCEACYRVYSEKKQREAKAGAVGCAVLIVAFVVFMIIGSFKK
jgi:hypothetical protein